MKNDALRSHEHHGTRAKRFAVLVFAAPEATGTGLHGYVTRINNLEAILHRLSGPLRDRSLLTTRRVAACVIKDNGTHNQLSDSMLTPLDGLGFEGGYVEANALNDVGSVAGTWQYFFKVWSEEQVSFSGDASWLLSEGSYGVSFLDGYNESRMHSRSIISTCWLV